MTISQIFPYSENAVSGVLQYMKNDKLIKDDTFSYSSVYDNNYLPSNILTLDNTYFNTITNKTDNANFFVINLSHLFVYPKGYIVKSDPRADCAYLRSWKLYGSLNGKLWIQIHSIFEQDDLKAGSVKRYQLIGGPFNLFKVVQTGPCLGTSDDYYYRLRIAYLDFFGYATSTYREEKTCNSRRKSNSFPITLFILITIS